MALYRIFRFANNKNQIQSIRASFGHELSPYHQCDRPLRHFSYTEDEGVNVQYLKKNPPSDFHIFKELLNLRAIRNSDVQGMPHASTGLVGITQNIEDFARSMRISVEEAGIFLSNNKGLSPENQAINMNILKDLLKSSWESDATEAFAILEKPDYIDETAESILGDVDPCTDDLIIINGILKEAAHTYDNQIEVETGDESYQVFENTDLAGDAAVQHFTDMRDHDSCELRSLIGDEALIAWALGKSASPGNTSVRSLDEWIELWRSVPEELFAMYDGRETVIEMSRNLADKLDLDSAQNNRSWVMCVGYRT